MLPAWLDPLEPWVKVSLPTRRAEKATTSCPKAGPAPFRVGLCEQNWVNVIGNYNSGRFTSIAIVSVIFDGSLQEISMMRLSLTQSSAFSALVSTLKSSSR